ncbi:cell wall-binding repeat-containing protein [Herbiconiux sp. YIM B11900]|uniref:cell wall-binding repeat-containing protein n=1 Tax=Herbiconiux sp. YIM B11900 TaxID=3404131 RepID=UPI003F86EBAB
MKAITRLAFILAVGLGVTAGLTGTAAPASADEGETHTISGHAFARDAEGDPTITVPVYVGVETPSLDAVYHGQGTNSGPYEVAGVPDGEYLVEFVWATDPNSPDALGYATTWAGGTPYRSEAQLVVVDGADVSLDIEMPRGAGLTGILTTAPASQQDFRIAEAYLVGPDGSYTLTQSASVTGLTVQTDGRYRLRGLADADYVIRFSERARFGGHDFETQYWPGTRSRDDAERVHPVAGQLISDMDITLQPWSPRVVDRLAGTDRFEAAAAISASEFGSGVPVVFVANGLNYPDALSAGPAAARLGGPVLLVTPTGIPAAIAAELDRLKPARIVVVGGERSVGPAVYGQLAAATPQIERIAGADRYEVSRNVARFAFAQPSIRPQPPITNIVFADGRGFADALTAGAAVSLAEGSNAVVLVDGSKPTVDPATEAFVREVAPQRLYIAGGVNSVPQGFEDSLEAIQPGATRIGGADRYEVSAAIAGTIPAHYGGEIDAAYFAVGTTYPDALTGAAVAAARGTNLYIVHPDCVPAPVLERLRINGHQSIRLLGGPNSLTPAIEGLPSC